MRAIRHPSVGYPTDHPDLRATGPWRYVSLGEQNRRILLTVMSQDAVVRVAMGYPPRGR